MATDIMSQIEAYEDNILNSIGSFIKAVLHLPIYLKDKPFIAPTSPYITVRVVTSNNSGGWGQRETFENETQSYIMDNTYQIEVMCYRGRPMPALAYLLSALIGFQELKYELMYSKGISFLSATNITEANTILDGDKSQLRGRIILTFNTRMISEDAPTTEIVEVKGHISSYRNRYTDEDPLTYYFDDNYPLRDWTKESNTEYQFINQEGLPEGTYSTWVNEWTT